MKYQKPQLKIITKLFACAICSAGSGATPFDACNAGGNADGGCVNGTTAAVTNCLNGYLASFWGTGGCQIGLIAQSTECASGSAV